MGMIALRGTPSDYDDWEKSGAAGWGWTDVLPYFCKLENDWNFKGDLHGDAGPVPIRRVDRAAWPPLALAAEDFARARRLPFVADMNADFRDGYCSLPISNTLQSRASSAICYLGPEVRRRGNLTIATSATVTQILFEGHRAVAVKAQAGGQEREFRGKDIILSTGAIFSPAMLLRAGIGAAGPLRELGIPVVADLPGVGANLQNHPVLYIGLHLERGALQAAALRTVPAIAFRYSSGMIGCPPHDLYVNVQNKTSWNALGRRIGNIAPTLLRPASRGRVSLVSPDPLVQPRVEFNFLEEEVDMQRLMQVFTFAVELVCSEQVRAVCGLAFPVRFTDRIRSLNERSMGNAARSSLVALMLDAVPGINDLVFRTLTGRRVDLKALTSDPQRLAQHIRENVSGVFHPTGTCRMGRADDRDAVVDTEGRVHGVAGLRVADASIMPHVIAGNTNIPTIMVAEKIAAAIGDP
jgi:5-(hydroxymethyl)furfural/furfural oxidase